MIPNFALTLSFEGIGLLRRMGRKWARIDEVTFDDSDLANAMATLRDRALELDPKGAEVALLIPNEQIRYLTMPDLGGDEIAREVSIRAGLDGATPYAVSDLCFDYALADGEMQVAAVANETLEEAQQFAESHGFTPVCFAAQAPEGAFATAVYFGKAKGWRRAARRFPQPVTIIRANKRALTPVAAKDDPKPDQAAQAEAELPLAPAPEAAPDIAPQDDAAQAAPETSDASGPDADAAPAADATDIAAAAPDADPAPAEHADPDPVAAVVPEPVSDPIPDATDAAGPSESGHAPDAGADEADETALAEHDPATEGLGEDAQSAFELTTHTDPAPQSAAMAAAQALHIDPADAAPELDPDPALAAISEPVTDPLPELDDLALADLEDADPAPAIDHGADHGADPAIDPALDTDHAPATPSDNAAPALAARREDLDPHPAPAPSFATMRASREADDIPPAPRPLTLGDDTVGIAPRFTPVLDRAKATQEAGITASRLDIDEYPDADDPDQNAPGNTGKTGARAAAAAAFGLLRKRKPKDTAKGKDASIPAIATARAAAPVHADTDLDRPIASTDLMVDPVAEAPAVAQPVVADPIAPAPLAEAPIAPPQTDEKPVNALARLAALRDAGTASLTAEPPAVAPPPKKKPRRGRRAKAKTENLIAAPVVDVPAAQDERDRMTVFGMRKDQKIGGKPRFLGLMLTTVLLIFLAGVAAWASVFLDDGLASLFKRGEDQAPTALAAAPDLDADAVNPDLPATAAEAPVAPLAEAAVIALPSPDLPADDPADLLELAALADGEPEVIEDVAPALSEPIPLRELTPEEATAIYAATGVWQKSPAVPLTPPLDGVNDIYVASIDPGIQQFDAVALPDPVAMSREPLVLDPGLPPPAGMVFDFDARGLVRAKDEGALSPDGMRIFTGRPPVIPPLRTALAAPAPVDPQTDALTNPLAAIRPQSRPDDLVEQRERAEFAGISRQELAAFRPVMRPKTAQEEAQEAAPDAEATALAVKSSLQPVGRPRNMAAIVKRAQEAAPAAAVQTAAVAPRVVAPSGPTATTVARAATDQNAINLNKVSLIGVYGTPSKRRALVRLPGSGKYEKVVKGDRLDGGRVQEIQESALIYIKNGRSITLKMPRG